MGSKKKQKTPAKSAGKAKPAKAANPFELKGSKRKFEVLGRREKTGNKTIVQSREAAVAKVRAGCWCRARSGRPPPPPLLPSLLQLRSAAPAC